MTTKSTAPAHLVFEEHGHFSLWVRPKKLSRIVFRILNDSTRRMWPALPRNK